MFLLNKKTFFAIAILASFFILGSIVLAQDDGECAWDKIEQGEKSLSKEGFQALLEKCKAYYEQKSGELEKDIQKTASDKKTLSSEIATLKSKIKNLDYKISQSSIMVKDLGTQIKSTENSIGQTQSQILTTQERLALTLQLRYEEDHKSMVEVLLGERSLSAFFDNLVALENLNMSIQDLLGEIKGLKTNLETQKIAMDGEKKSLESTIALQNLQKSDSSKQKLKQEDFLKMTEKEYQKYLAEQKDAKEKASKIGSLLFQLLEVPEGGIKFEDAVALAKTIANQTGIRAAFSLGILWQETRIGKVQGGCYLKDTSTGEGVYIKSGNKALKTMSPTRDVPKFLDIVGSLNKAGKLKTDAFTTPVSCCMISGGQYIGWGGAMGPAQFIPSTWVRYADKIAEASGNAPANPWNIRDAFLANALLLKDNGAGAKTYEAEIKAAQKYFSGTTSSFARKNYGVPVMNAAACMQGYIDDGSMSDSCQDLIF
ncbi:MAG: lytic murein transglycosylase [Patescibacteria group bacterium]